MALVFTLSDRPQVRPEDLDNRSTLVNCSLDKEMHEVVTRAAAAAGQPLSSWTLGCLHFMADLDNVLLAILEGRARRKVSCISRSHQMKVPQQFAQDIKDAIKYLRARGYPLLSNGAIIEACLILRAESENLLPKIK